MTDVSTAPGSPTHDDDVPAPTGRRGPTPGTPAGGRAGPRLGWATASALAVGWGVLAAWWTPRTPQTTGEALLSMGISLAVGVGAGMAARSRWAMVAAPVGFAVAFELIRLPLDGPTVDGIHTSLYGLMALVVGRGLHALLSLAPLALGAVLGAALARRRTPTLSTAGAGRHLRRATAVTAALALAALALALARPASTPPITDAAGVTVPGSVAELTAVDVGGTELGLLVRGHSTDNPVLLFLAGGPGGAEMGAMRNHLPALEEHFTVATLDQRGAGTSYRALDPTAVYSVQRAVDDVTATTEYLRERFGKERIYVLGQSWGTLLGVLAVQQHPDLYAAFVGAGQMVSPLETDRIFYADTLAWADANGSEDLAAELRRIGQPPYDDMLDYETALSHEEDVYPYDHRGNSEGMGGFSENFVVPEHTLVDQVHMLGAFMDTFGVLYPQIQGIDLRADAASLPVPVFFTQGQHEARGRAEPFEEWFAALDAPEKELVVIDGVGHRPLFERPAEFVAFMTGTVLDRTGER